jgi:predicted TIM-barrel fold metal-dependent hydrolase
VLDGMFVFDSAIHVYDASDENVEEKRDDSVYTRDWLTGWAAAASWPGVEKTARELQRRWSIEEVYDLVFVQSVTDIAMVQVVPLFEWYKDFFAPVEVQHAMAEKYPDRVIFCGGVDPLNPDVPTALRELERQIVELGARSIKFYNGHAEGGWRCDDRELAYPLYQKCLELGVDVVQFHKGVPFGLQPVENLSPLDLQRAARDFPEMTFLIHHLALPYFEECVSVASRFPNIHLNLAGNINAVHIAPREVQTWIGRLLRDVGIDKLVYGSDAALLGPPQPYLDAIAALEIPEDLRSGYGYPQFTREDKEKFFGLNFAKMLGIDVPAKQLELSGAAA